MGLSILSVKSTRFIISYKRCISTFSIRSSLILLSYLLCSITCLPASSPRKLALAPFHSLVEVRRFELLTPCLQSRCSPS